MNRFPLRSLIRAGIFVALLCAPLALVPTVNAANDVFIEAPGNENSGMGFVLLVSLQRA